MIKRHDTNPLTIDIEALRRKYAQEREKRVRPEGLAQFEVIEDKDEELLKDPFVEELIERDPIEEESDIAIIGAGLSGMMTAIRLRESSVKNMRIIDKAGDFGGTWYWNRYPGAACDIDATVYLPMLEETGYTPKEKYARSPEIFEHCQRLGRHFDLYRAALFQTAVRELRWDESDRRWLITTDRGDRIKARYVVIGMGNLSRPKLPRIPGIHTFKGKAFHTCRWDYNYTGGDSAGGMIRLGDKRVGVIGTGATAVQVVPQLAKYAEKLLVFQRTPSSIDVRGNAPVAEEWSKELAPGWQRERLDNFEALTQGIAQEKDLVNDAWTDFGRVIARVSEQFKEAGRDVPPAEELVEISDYIKMESLRERIAAIVKDPETAEALKPYYKLHCKRPCFSDEYLDVFNQDNVRLVDTGGHGVERFTERGVIVDGEEYPVDCIIFATGFDTFAPPTRSGGFQVYGVQGQSLEQRWTEQFNSLHGIGTHGFPNLFIAGGVRGGAGAFNVFYLIEKGTAHLAWIISTLLERGVERAEITSEAVERWTETLNEVAPSNLEAVNAECTPGYYNSEGMRGKSAILRANLYGGGTLDFFALLDDWRMAGLLDTDFDLVS
jgi:cyclohexanone monooxygenase